jgi:hypothetical protein
LEEIFFQLPEMGGKGDGVDHDGSIACGSRSRHRAGLGGFAVGADYTWGVARGLLWRMWMCC